MSHLPAIDADSIRLDEFEYQVFIGRLELLERERAARASAEQTNRLKDQFLAIVVPRAAHAAERAAPTVDRLLEGVRVLVVDDDEESRAIVAEYLESHHASVATAASAAEALEMLERNPPHVLLADRRHRDARRGWLLADSKATRVAPGWPGVDSGRGAHRLRARRRPCLTPIRPRTPPAAFSQSVRATRTPSAASPYR